MVATLVFDGTETREVKMAAVGMSLPTALSKEEIVPFLSEAAYEAMQEMHPDFVEAIEEDFDNDIPEHTMLTVNEYMGTDTGVSTLLTAAVEGTIRHIYATREKAVPVPVVPQRPRDNTDDLVDSTFAAEFITDELRVIYRLIVQESAYDTLQESAPGILATHERAHDCGVTLADAIEMSNAGARLVGASEKAIRLANVAAEYIWAGKPNAFTNGVQILRERSASAYAASASSNDKVA